MNQSAEESLMALLEAMLTLAAGTEARRQPPKPTVNPGGYPEEMFLDLSEDDQEELSCSICYQVLKETMQCINHHKFCHSCLVVWSTTGEYANRVKCPVCRTRGYYFRNDDIDTKVGNKKVKCRLESCTWTGQLKNMNSHRHNTYGEESGTVSETDSKTEITASSSIPRLEQVVPRAPPATAARFVGTGLTTRNANIEAGQQSIATPRHQIPGRTASRISTSSLSSNSQETVIDIGRGRGRRGSNSNTTTSILAASRRAVPPVRTVSNNNNRITFSHSRPNAGNLDTNNGTEGSAPVASISDSTEGLAGGFTPRPPSAPRTASNSVNPRRLPRIVNPLAPPRSRPMQPQTSSEAPGTNGANNEAQVDTGTNLGNIRNHLQDSRNRLNNLMSSFTNELDRNRQEMMQFQQERESQRREQLEEVRQLSQRLGQVAFELRRLLEHRRRMPSFSDSEDDD